MIRLLVTFLLLATVVSVSGKNPKEKGLEIAMEVKKRDQGFQNNIANMEMVLLTKSGKESRRELRVRTLEGIEDGDKSLILFDVFLIFI